MYICTSGYVCVYIYIDFDSFVNMYHCIYIIYIYIYTYIYVYIYTYIYIYIYIDR